MIQGCIYLLTIIIQFGKVVHFSIDLALFSTCLAGIKRNTGLTPKLDTIQEPNMKEYASKYLNLGESLFDYMTASFGSSSYFQRK